MSVSEGTGGGRRREADTELKTKTPHVNVGKNNGENGAFMGKSMGK